MKIHHLRNATCVVESGEKYILVDPMLSKKGALPPFSRFRFKPQRNPLVELPANASGVLDKVTHCLLTHSQKWNMRPLQHTDHLDLPGEKFLRDRDIPVTTLAKDAKVLRKYGLNIHTEVEYWQPQRQLGGEVIAVPARHGHGWVRCLMANGAGYFVRLPGEPTLYVSGDTVYTEDVERALVELKPDVAIMAAGTATLDISTPLLMSMDELLTFARTAPGKVIANHLEALNHCPTSRDRLRKELEKNNLLTKVRIPEDGDVIDCG